MATKMAGFLKNFSKIKRILVVYFVFALSLLLFGLLVLANIFQDTSDVNRLTTLVEAQAPSCGVPYCDDACRSCGPTGCSGQCTGNPINEFYCRGATAGCGDGMPTYLGYDDVSKGTVTPQIRYLDLKKKAADNQVVILW